MLKKTIKYTDYNGVEREEDFYFNLNKAEATELEMSVNGGLSEFMKTMVSTQNSAEIIKIFKKIILLSYGEKSNDGKRFIKSEGLSKAFSETEAYVELFMELGTNASAGADFINGILPKGAVDSAKANANIAVLNT